MPNPSVLEFTLAGYTETELAIKVKNISGALLEKSLAIELYPPSYLVDTRINDKATEAATSTDPPGVASLVGLVTAAAGWSLWAKREATDSIAVVMLLNDRDQSGAEITPIKMLAGAEFVIRIPLNRQASRATVDLLYSYESYVGEEYKRVDGKIELKSAESDWTPNVTLTTDHPTPTMILPATDVKIFWKISDGVSATLRGPLPGGNSEWSLSDTASGFKMSDGWFQLKAVGPMTYILHAEVKRPDGKPNVQVVRMLSLDVYTKEKYGFVDVRPDRVLPFGLVEIDWAAWGVNEVIIDAQGGTRKIPLTDMTLSGTRQGAGVMRITAGKYDKETPVSVSLTIEIDRKPRTESSKPFTVIPWRKMAKSVFTGQPIGLAVAAPKMALLTTDGLWIAKVGEHDFEDNISYQDVTNVPFSQPAGTDRPKAWLAVAALNKRFVVLRQTNENDLQVAFFNSEGRPDSVLPIDLPADLRRMMSSTTIFDLAVYNNRAYVVVEAQFQAGPVRRAFSIGINSQTNKAEYRTEPMLENMAGYRLLAFDNALYAFNRTSGQMFRFTVTTDGRLECYKAANAVNQAAAVMATQGLLVSVGRVMAVLSPTALPSLASLQAVGRKNVLRYQSGGLLRDPNTITQDLVYSPQNNRWTRCGHGLDVKVGLVAFRSGASPRLWVIEPNGDTYTLTVKTEHLFLHDYVTDLPSKPLAPFLDKKREFTIISRSGMQFVPIDGNDTCARAGITAFGATGPVELTSPPPTNLRPGAEEKFELRYNEADPPTTTLRFLMKRPGGIKNEYFLEVTLFGADLSKATTVFKRIAVDGRGVVSSIAEVPETRQEHSTAGPIAFFGKGLVNGITLRIRNATPYPLWLRSPEAPDASAREKEFKGEDIYVKYSAPAFSIYAHGADELFFNVDFAMSHGMEQTWGSEAPQTKRLRVNSNVPLGLRIESVSVTEGPYADVYECTLRYKVERDLGGLFIGDGVPSKDGTSIYLPLASPSAQNRSDLYKLRANDFLIEGQVSLDASGLFSAPNSVALLADKVIAVLKDNWLAVYDLSLKFDQRIPLHWHNVVTNLKGGHNDTKFFTLGMKEQAGGPLKYSYSYASRSFARTDEADMLLDAQKGFRPARVQGAPAWVAPTTISPMDVSAGMAVAICVEGGIFLIDLRGKRVMEIGIDGTGREEAILIDPIEPLVFCAHARPDTQALMISRISTTNPSEKQTITLSSPVTHMLTDTKPLVSPNLRYNRPRAVSLAVTPDTLFVSHARKIYVLDKRRLTERQQVEVNLPCRLIQVRRGKPPGESHPRYGTPKECYLVWAIGSLYMGDGTNREKFRTSLYKIGIMQ